MPGIVLGKQRLFVLALSRGFGFFLPLDARLLVALSFTEFRKDARFRAGTLETTQRAVDRLVLFHSDFCHSVSPPSRWTRGILSPSCYIIHTETRFVNSFLPKNALFCCPVRHDGLFANQGRFTRSPVVNNQLFEPNLAKKRNDKSKNNEQNQYCKRTDNLNWNFPVCSIIYD